MKNQSIASLTMAYREEFTSAALLRSTNIENCAPDGYFKIIHSCAKATRDGEPKPISEIRKVYNTSKKGSKEIRIDLGKITALPFPIIDSEKKMGLQFDKTVSSPLYDVSTGNTVAERYAYVNMSYLGKLLTRHYLDVDLNDIDYYNSIVPYSLLRRSMPFAMGFKSDMYPLNPKELFIIMKEMIKANSPFIDASILEDNFKGFDLGDNYTIYMTKEALLELYTNGVSSFLCTPDIEIDRKNNEIRILVPPLDSTSKKLRNALIQNHGSKSKAFRTFSYDIDVKLVGKKVIMYVDNWYGTDEEIRKELISNSLISVKKQTSNITIRYKKKDKNSTTEDILLGKKIKPNILTKYEPFKSMTQDELKALTQEKIKSIMKKNNILPDMLDTDTNYKDIVMGLTNSMGETLEYTGENPYSYEIDKVPVIEVLWECIEGERELQKIKITKQLAALREKLKYDLLYEKASRPNVAEIIYKYQKEKQQVRINKLLETCHKDSEVLPEGFERWEAEEIYKYTGNNFLAKIFERSRFENEFITTQEQIANLEEKINNVAELDKEIIADLNTVIENPKYNRKSKVFFLKEESASVVAPLQPTHFWDKQKLPVSIYYNEGMMIRSYGTNLYVNKFMPKLELRTRNDKKIGILYTTKEGKVELTMKKVSDIPRNGFMPMPFGLRGVIPLFEDEEITIFTNKAKYYRYKGIPSVDFNFDDDEYIVGFLANPYRYIDILCSKGIQTIDMMNAKYFKTKFNKLGNNILDLYDIRERKEINNEVPILTNRSTFYVSDNKLLKTYEGNPVPLQFSMNGKVFSEHIALFVDNMYVPEWSLIDYGIVDEKYRPNRPVCIQEFAPIKPYTDNISKSMLEKYKQIKDDRLLENGKEYLIRHVISFATPSYYNIDIHNPDLKNIIDYRLLEKR